MSTTGESKRLTFDPAGALDLKGGVTRADFEKFSSSTAVEARASVAKDLDLYKSGGEVPAAQDPLDAGFIEMPQRLWSEYEEQGAGSELGQILACAKRLQEQVDRVVVLGIGGSYMGARALMDTCCQPYFNELSRAERGGNPRIYFEGNNVDNDHSQALLRMLGNGKPADSVNDRWAIVVISKSGGTLETAVAFRQFAERLQHACQGDAKQVAQLIVPVTGESGKLASLADALGCVDRFLVPDGVGGRFSVLSAVGLLPAAIMGIDIIALLKGAVEMTDRFWNADPGDNPVLDYAALYHLLEEKMGIDQRVMSVWSKSLETAGLWYDQLLAESLGKDEKGALPLTVVNTRDLHSRAQQHQQGKRDKVMTNVVLGSWREDPLPVGKSEHDQDGLNQISGKALPDIMKAALDGTNEAYQSEQRPTTDLHLAGCDAFSLGQYFQMLMLATVLEGKFIDVNPYGQPGVESYKINMKRNLDMS